MGLRFGAAPSQTLATSPPIGGNCIIRAATRRRYTASQLLMLQNPHRHRRGGCGKAWMAWLRCPWVAAGPGQAPKQRAEPDISDPAPLVWRAPEGPEGTGGIGGPGCGARGRWRGLAGLRDDAPSEARGADGSRAGRRPRAHQVARPARVHQHPEHPWGHKATRQDTAKGPKRRSASGPSRVSVAHRLSWMLRPGTASISSRV